MESYFSGILFVIVVSSLLALCIKYAVSHSRKSVTIPGPKEWPIIGNSFQLGPSDSHIVLTSWARQFGDVYSINLMGKKIFVVSGEESIREVLIHKTHDFSDRPSSFANKYSLQDAPFLGFYNYTQRYQSLKKYTLRHLKMYGEGLKMLEVSLDIIDDLIFTLKSKSGTSFDPQEDIGCAIVNILLSLIIGNKLEKNDPLIKKIIYYQTVVVNRIFFASSAVFLDVFPWLRHFGIFQNYVNMVEDFRFNYIEGVIGKMVKKQHPDKSNPQCFLDVLLRDKSSAIANPIIQDKDVLGLANTVLGAGTPTSIATIMSLLAILSVHQDVQTRLRNHIRDVIGERKPHLSDQKQLPLVQSCIMEILRFASVIPLGQPHMTSQDSKIGNYPVRKGDIVWTNLWSFHHDERYWDEPWEFKLDRFLDDKGEVLPPDHSMRKRFLPFGAGSRACLGENLAKNRLFLLVTSLLQHFRFIPDEPPPECDPRNFLLGISIQPKPYKIKVLNFD